MCLQWCARDGNGGAYLCTCRKLACRFAQVKADQDQTESFIDLQSRTVEAILDPDNPAGQTYADNVCLSLAVLGS